MPKKSLSWRKIAKGLESWGWFAEEIDKNKVILERGRQRIIARKIPSTGKWKVEYYSGKIMDDATGFHDEDFAKIMASEMAILK